MLHVWAKMEGGSICCVRAWMACSSSLSNGSGLVAPCTIALGWRRAAASSTSSQSGSGRQSSSVKATSGARAARQPRFLWRAGVPVPGSSLRCESTPACANGWRSIMSATSSRESCATTTSKRSRPSVCSSSAFRSQRRRTGRSCDGTTTDTSSTPRASVPSTGRELTGAVVLYAPVAVRVLCVGNICPPHDMRGGYELTWRSSVLHLRDRGHEVRVLASDHRAPGVTGELDPDVHRELHWYWRGHAFPRHGLRERIGLERHNAAVLTRHLEEFRPDVVAWWGMGGMSLGLIERVRRLGIPAVGVVGDEWMRWGLQADAWLKPLHGRPRLGALAERLTGAPGEVDLDGAATWLFNSERTR